MRSYGSGRLLDGVDGIYRDMVTYVGNFAVYNVVGDRGGLNI
jgi:hypothetical protein